LWRITRKLSIKQSSYGRYSKNPNDVKFQRSLILSQNAGPNFSEKKA